jgi:hypothetical protein
MPQFVLLLPASLVGLTLLALPLAAHLISRRTRLMIVFPSTSQLHESSIATAKWRQLRDWLVLALRCLTVALLVLAVGNFSYVSPSDPHNNDAQRAIVLLIDDQLTTQLTSDAGSVFEQLQRQADDILANHNGEAAIVWSTSNDASAQWHRDMPALRSELATREPKFTDANQPAAWQIARRLLREKTGPRELVVLTDRTADAWRFALADAPEMRLPEGVALSLRGPTFSVMSNISLSAPAIKPAVGSALEPRTATAVLAHAGEQAVSGRVRFRAGDGPTQSQDITLPPDSRTTVSFDFVPGSDGNTVVRFSIERDDFLPDNTLQSICRVSTKPPAAVVAPPRQMLIARRLELAVGNEPARPLGEGDTDHILLLIDAPLSQTELSTMEQFVLDGGQLMIWPTGDSPLDSDTWPADWPRLSDAVHTGKRQIARVDLRHPVTRIFTGASEVALTRVTFDRIRTVTAGPAAETPLRFDDDQAALATARVGAGRVIVVAFDIDTNATRFSRTGLFVALVQQAMATHVRFSDEPSSHIGQPVRLTIPNAAAASTLLTPAGAEAHDFTITSVGTSSIVRLPVATLPGIYNWRVDDAVIASAAVNVPASSSRFDRLPEDALRQQLQSLVTRSDNNAIAGRSTTSLAGLCFMLALVCLAGELMITLRRDR